MGSAKKSQPPNTTSFGQEITRGGFTYRKYQPDDFLQVLAPLDPVGDPPHFGISTNQVVAKMAESGLTKGKGKLSWDTANRLLTKLELQQVVVKTQTPWATLWAIRGGGQRS